MRPSEALAKHREEARSVLSGYAVANPRIFGSAARGMDGEESDLDIIVKPAGALTYLDLARLEEDLSALFGVKVDIRTEGEFSERVLTRIRRDFVDL